MKAQLPGACSRGVGGWVKRERESRSALALPSLVVGSHKELDTSRDLRDPAFESACISLDHHETAQVKETTRRGAYVH